MVCPPVRTPILLLEPAVTPHDFAMGILTLLALFLAGIWLLLNGYQYIPVARRGFARALTRTGLRRETDEVAGFASAPTIDILLPAYDEAAVIGQAIESIHAADYPQNRLRLHILTEPDDDATRERLWQLLDRFDFRLHRIPADYPGTPNKPRALDYGFSLTDGDIVGVLDAEDLVAPHLFQSVASAFDDQDCAYALGHLDMANEDDGWLNLLFRAEYGFWYDLVVPAFADNGYPIPLGGTTCFFRRETLEAIADVRIDRFGSPWSRSDLAWLRDRNLPADVPWDPNSVTEDFELGLLLWQEGFGFRYLDATTREESPIGLQGWLNQRTRWQKGKLWTFKQFLDVPPRGLRRRFHLYWQSLLPHLGPLNLLGITIVFWLSTIAGVDYGPIVAGGLAISLAFAVATSLLFTVGYWRASDRPRYRRARRAIVVCFSLPFYWLLQWIADVRALLDLSRGHLDWTPSEHLGRHFDTDHRDAATIIERPTPGPALSTWTATLGLGGILLLAAALRLYNLDRWSLWSDELYTITDRGAAPLTELLVGAGDPHPPGYYLLAHGWMAVFGSDPTAMRLQSVVFSLGAIIAIFALGRTLYDVRTGLLAALLLGTSTAHIHYSRTVRMYSLFTFLAVLSWYGYVSLRTDEQCIPWLGAASGLTVGGYIVATLGLLYTHVYGVFVLASQYLYRWLSDSGKIPDRRWRTVQSYVLIGALPWVVVLGARISELLSETGGSAIDWIPPPGFGLLRETLLLHAGYPLLYPIQASTPFAWAAVTVVSFVFNVCLVFAVLTYDSEDEPLYYLVDGRQAGLLAVFLLVPIVIPFLLSYLVPIYVPRYTIAATIPLVLLIARGLVNIRSGHWRLLFLGIILCGAAITIGTYYSSPSQENWRGVASQLDDATDTDDLLVVQPSWVEGSIEYYAERLPDNRYILQRDRDLGVSALDTLVTRARNHQTVWLVTYDAQATPAVIRRLEERHSLVETTEWGAITVHRFERRPERRGDPQI